VEIRIANDTAIDDDGTPGTGEVLIRGGIVMQGYFRRPDATGEALRDGWLHTGDLGYLDKDGRLFITGRRKEIIVLSSGKNLYPEEIEAHYRQSAFIKELCVLGLSRPGEPAAERLHAVVVPDEDALRARGTVNVRELLRFEIEELSVRFPPHKRILTYDIAFDPLPRTTTGKLRRGEIERRIHSNTTTSRDDPPSRRLRSAGEEAWLQQPGHGQLLAIIASQLGRPEIAPDANLELDLGLDSMERIELLTAVETSTGRQVPAEARAAIFTIRQLVDAVLEGAQAVSDRPAAGTVGSAGEPQAVWAEILSDAPETEVGRDLARPALARALIWRALLMAAALVARLFIRWEAVDRDRLPTSGPFLVCPNHQSYLDGFFLAAALPFRAFRELFLVGAAEYFQTPLRRRLARTANIVPVDADAHLVSAMQAAAVGLRLGKVLILFPEGERSIDGTVRPFRKGAAILASTLRVPIVPVGISGLHALWPRGRSIQWRRLRPWRRPRVTIAFGSLLRPTGTDYAEATVQLQAAVTGNASAHGAPLVSG
jgi:long-chain acyl-CoA synthetase